MSKPEDLPLVKTLARVSMSVARRQTTSDQVCAGHTCDACKTCLRGRCCRRDNPYYQLPHTGDHQPFFGVLGKLDIVDELIQCHICGLEFDEVGIHSNRKHDVNAAEYRALFGLNVRTALSSARRRQARRNNPPVLAALEAGRPLGFAALARLTPEQRSHNSTIAPRRVQRRKAVFSRSAIVAALEARSDPLKNALWRTRLSEARSGPDIEHVCVQCGTTFTSKASRHRRTCSPECALARRRVAGAENGRAAAKLSDAQVAEIRARYSGVRGEQAALAAEFGVSPSRIGQIVHEVQP